jgi:hypothetical protein
MNIANFTQIKIDPDKLLLEMIISNSIADSIKFQNIRNINKLDEYFEMNILK